MSSPYTEVFLIEIYIVEEVDKDALLCLLLRSNATAMSNVGNHCHTKLTQQQSTRLDASKS
jgi:hypothetical protein